MENIDILYICGPIGYEKSVSGNYYIYKILCDHLKKYNNKCISIWDYPYHSYCNPSHFIKYCHWDRLKSLSKEKLIELLPNHKILFLCGDEFTEDQLLFIKNHYNCKIFIMAMTSWVFGNRSESYPEIEGSLLSDIAKQRSIKYEQANIDIINASSYSSNIQSISFFKNLKNHIIPLITTENMQKYDKEKNINREFKTILWGTTQPECFRKGKHKLENILNILYKKYNKTNIKINNVGPITNINSPYEVISHGILDKKEMANMYHQSDVFALTTLADSGPMMATECVYNETPLVSYNTNIALDITNNGINGYTVNTDEKFADKLYEILFEQKYKMSIEYLFNFSSTEKILEKYESIFDKYIQ